jgi:hypothetical protein
MRSRSKRAWIIGGLICVLAFLGYCFFSVRDRSDAAIRNEILNATPIGSTEDSVERYAKSRLQHYWLFRWEENDDRKTLKVHYDGHNKAVEWEFDQGGKLAGVSVYECWID